MYIITIEKSTGNYYQIRTDDEEVLKELIYGTGPIDVENVRYYCSASDVWRDGRVIILEKHLVSIDVSENGG